ncbi:SEC-C domain-containing protein [Halosquirtibacter laminarini]|uniref:SEC-C domain-containing protein n=1 Tax=Halosquirtibacter laminarini TaxID=3374600 RepID=A0AC61NG50_9BACT|nr:SEC-C domain-containing protein [Prolixibacteraceae bacterium]
MCVCGKIDDYNDCCGRYISRKEVADSPETLMRSRFTAFSLGEVSYILDTERIEKPNTMSDLKAWCDAVTYTKLDVISSNMSQDNGEVHFKAYYKEGMEQTILEEHSQFIKDDSQWYYTSGKATTQQVVDTPTISSSRKMGRNEPCWCGSGKKFKKCCGK